MSMKAVHVSAHDLHFDGDALFDAETGDYVTRPEFHGIYNLAPGDTVTCVVYDHDPGEECARIEFDVPLDAWCSGDLGHDLCQRGVERYLCQRGVERYLGKLDPGRVYWVVLEIQW